MNEVDYLDHNRAESLQFEEKPDIKPPDVEQLQDADINQTAGKNKHSWNAKKSANSCGAGWRSRSHIFSRSANLNL